MRACLLHDFWICFLHGQYTLKAAQRITLLNLFLPKGTRAGSEPAPPHFSLSIAFNRAAKLPTDPSVSG